jgi:CheY-like chemotaxis protein
MDKHRVLIADDNAMLRMAIQKVLQHAGLDVVAVGDGQQALLAAQREHFDLIVLDSNMPVLSGPDACQALKADPALAGVFVILLSGEEEPAPCGADRYVLKDRAFAGLVQVIHEFFPT